MKKQLYSLVAFFIVFFCQAQVSISQAEYFWDTDPGVGNATPILATDGSLNSAFEQLSKTGIPAPSAGLHKFCIRMKDSGGLWGSVFTNVVFVEQAATTTAVSISQAEYFWDNDPGFGNGTPILAFDGNFNSAFESISTAIPFPSAVGLHVFNIRIKDSSGLWGSIFKNVVAVQTPLSVGEIETLKALKAYPNPVNDILTVSFDREIASVSVYNLVGQHVISKTINANEGKVDFSKLETGTYFVKVAVGNDVKTLKVIKK